MKIVDGEATGGLFWCRRRPGSGGGGAVGVGIDELGVQGFWGR